MTDLRKYNRGTIGNKGGGRPTKNDEIKLIEQLTPLEPEAYSALKAGLQRGEFKYVQLFFNYYYGKPKQITEIQVDEEVPLFQIEVVK
ncbi:hypothetical protein N9R90_00600 [Flavobacteriaceae bacterium]|jgi:hypothetical protein|nr:hypothetical protein [Flavobacteriaceae bacterium]